VALGLIQPLNRNKYIS